MSVHLCTLGGDWVYSVHDKLSYAFNLAQIQITKFGDVSYFNI